METLIEQSNFLLTNLTSLADKTVVEDVKALIKGTTVESQGPIYDFALEFYSINGKFPDSTTLGVKFPMMFEQSLGTTPWSSDLALDFLHSLRKEAASIMASEHLASGEHQKAADILTNLKPKKIRRKFGPDEATVAYDKMLESPAGIMLGIPELDEVMKGCSYGNMTVIGAPPGSFKTTTAISAVYKAVVKDKFNFVMISFEIMKKDMWFNFLSRHSAEMGIKIPAVDIKKGMMTEEQRANFELVKEDWKANCKGKLEILTAEDFNDFKPATLNRMWEELDEEMGGIDGMVVDYMQLLGFLRPAGTQKDDFLNDCVRYFTTLSTTWKKERGMIVFLLSQINREGEKKLIKKRRADKTSYAEINSLERDAHNGIVLFADAQMKLSNSMLAQVVKNRSGREMEEMVTVYVDPECYVVGAGSTQPIFSEKSLDLIDGAADDMFG